MNHATVQIILSQCLEKLKTSRHYNPCDVAVLMEKLKITFNDRLRTKAGCCRWTHINNKVLTIEIELSVLFLSRTTPEKHYELISHEFAHAYEAIQTGNSNHGPRWQSIHQAMGGSAAEFHTEVVPKNKVKRHTLVNVVTGQVFNNVSTRMMHKCMRTNEILGTVRFKTQGYRTV